MTARRLFQVKYYVEGEGWASVWAATKEEANKIAADAIRTKGQTPGFIAPVIKQRGVPVDPHDLAIWLTAENCGGSE